MQNNISRYSHSILITGANGFVGKPLCEELLRQGQVVRASMRLGRRDNVPVGNIETVSIDVLDGATDWTEALAGINVVVHLAARVHVVKDNSLDLLDELRKVNVEGAWNLALQAAEAGVRRFIFISSIKVNGEGTLPGRPYTAEDRPAPVDPYGISKFEAEDALLRLAYETGMEVVIIRPPLVYGPGVKANFHSMMHWLLKGIPLPLGAIHNKRSFVALDNLVDLIITCIDHPAAANQTFLAGDGEDMSTTELLLRLGKALDMPVKLVPVPIWMLRAGAALLGRQYMSQRLCNSLQVDISKTCELLGWHPPVSVDDALKKTAADFLQR
ncbi:UDP-glucose 4-epimerase family protein [Candidatus Methylobacter oryzae]|uniref:SDR family oxidoreductase n=1 Tax=Candidatus Methylobacter oryzae TaxID=2497749 RepID=A0ABY3C7I6_9GAMM|nr:SDR family oxidoreductase [Candidatus Methylobacter oryzae]TRW92007.1 SDR family oxidoreductase [Candidatus Methylobacter oryzae]